MCMNLAICISLPSRVTTNKFNRLSIVAVAKWQRFPLAMDISSHEIRAQYWISSLILRLLSDSEMYKI